VTLNEGDVSTPLTGVHGPANEVALCHWYVCPTPKELPERFSPTIVPGQAGPVASEVDVPGVGGTEHVPTLNSYTPISGVVAFLGAFTISVVMPTGVPLSFSGAN